jgi:Skp family chaperone for outer membrane proteins
LTLGQDSKMNILRNFIPVSLICMALTISFTTTAFATDHAIAVLNLGDIFTKTVAVKDIERQVAAYQEKDKVEIAAIEKKMRQQKTELLQQRAILSEQQFSEKSIQFKKMADEYQKKYKMKALTLRKAKESALRKVRETMAPIVDKIATERNINVILSNTEVLFAKDELYITDAVIAQLDKQLKTVKIELKLPAKK